MEMNKKKEQTQKTGDNLKEKINEFKSRIKNDNNVEKKNELDFEINRDLINQFKKKNNVQNKDNININEIHGNNRDKINIFMENIQSETRQKKNPNNKSFDICLKNKKEQTPKEYNDYSLIDIINIKKKNYLGNFESNIDKIRKIKANANNITNNKTNTNDDPFGFFGLKANVNKDKYLQRVNSINNINGFESKKAEIMNSILNKNNTSNAKVKGSGIGNKLNKKDISIKAQNENTTREKIQNIIYQWDRNKFPTGKKLEGTQGTPKYNYTPKSNNQFSTQKNSNVSDMNKNKNNTDSLESFADFSLGKNRNNSFSIPLRERKFNYESNLNNKGNNYKHMFNEVEIRNLSNRIRFLTKDDIKKMAQSTVNEILSLYNSIKSTFIDSNSY